MSFVSCVVALPWIKLEIWGNWSPRQHLELICHVCQKIPEQPLQCGREHWKWLCWKMPLPLGNTVNTKVCTWSVTIFRLVIGFKVTTPYAASCDALHDLTHFCHSQQFSFLFFFFAICATVDLLCCQTRWAVLYYTTHTSLSYGHMNLSPAVLPRITFGRY